MSDTSGVFSAAELVRRRAEAEGEAGRAWLAGLDGLVRDLAQEWRLTLGAAVAGGSASLVIEVATDDGRAAVLKLVVPGPEARSAEPQVLRAAGGRGYAELIGYDAERRAMLMERLGPCLADSGLPEAAQAAVICSALRAAWSVSPDGLELTDGATKAGDLAAFIEDRWGRLGRPCAIKVVETALRYAGERAAAFSPETAVLAHGDPHPHNTLAAPGGGWKFVDPDGLLIEPAYDLGVILRSWNEGLLAAPDPLAEARGRVERLAGLAGVAPEAVWQWAYIERCSTGLHLLELGEAAEAGDYLAVCEALAAA